MRQQPSGHPVTDGFLNAVTSVPMDDVVRDAAERHVLDTIAAIVSGRCLPPGRVMAAHTARLAAGPCSVTGMAERVSPRDAALLNGLLAHAGESDDSHESSRTHPGCSIVPAALAVAEATGASREGFLAGVVAGYQAAALISWLVWEDGDERRRAHASPTSLGGIWGSAVAAATVQGLDRDGVHATLAYAAQLSAGNSAWLRDQHHIEKAFVFAGMPAHHGVLAAELAASGLPGVPDILDSEPNVITAMGLRPDQSALQRAATEPPAIVATAIKKYSVGSPAQAAVQASENLVQQHDVSVDRIVKVEIQLPPAIAYIVNGRDMRSVSVQFVVAQTLCDGGFSFAAVHGDDGTDRPDIERVMAVTSVVPDESMPSRRQARVVLHFDDGAWLEEFVYPVRGSREDPMGRDEVEDKARQLLGMGLAETRVDAVVSACSLPEIGLVGALSAALRVTADPAASR